MRLSLKRRKRKRVFGNKCRDIIFCCCSSRVVGWIELPMRSLFMYDGYLSVVVLTLMMVETNSLIWLKLGFWMWRRSVAILWRKTNISFIRCCSYFSGCFLKNYPNSTRRHWVLNFYWYIGRVFCHHKVNFIQIQHGGIDK